MQEQVTQEARDRLAATVDRIFADGVMDPEERDELRELFSSGGLTVPDVKQVLTAFVLKTWGEVIEDGVVTDDERTKLENIIRELRVPANCVPDEVRRAIAAG